MARRNRLLRLRIRTWRWFTHELPWILGLVAVMLVWQFVLSRDLLPAPLPVAEAIYNSWLSGVALSQMVQTCFVLIAGFVLGSVLGIGLAFVMYWTSWTAWAADHRADWFHRLILPFCNLGKTLSPLSLTPLALLWFGSGFGVFLVSVSVFFSTALVWFNELGRIPETFHRISRELELTPLQKLRRVLIPAVLPHALQSARAQLALCWIVVIGAEMLASMAGLRLDDMNHYGLGNAIVGFHRAGQFPELVATVVSIGIVGVAVDRILKRWQERPRLVWGAHD